MAMSLTLAGFVIDVASGEDCMMAILKKHENDNIYRVKKRLTGTKYR